MTWTDIDEDLEGEEAGIALWGIATGLFILVNLLTPNSHNIVLGSIAGAFFLAFLIKTLGELERRGRAISKFRERPSNMREILADLEHDQWVKLTKYYANQEDEIQVSEEKLDYWKDLWVDYEELSEDMKTRIGSMRIKS